MKNLIFLLLISGSLFGQKEVFYPDKNDRSFYVFTPDPETSTEQRHQSFRTWQLDTIICEKVRHLQNGVVIESPISLLYRIGWFVYHDIYTSKWRWFRRGMLKQPKIIVVKEIYYRDIGWQTF